MGFLMPIRNFARSTLRFIQCQFRFTPLLLMLIRIVFRLRAWSRFHLTWIHSKHTFHGFQLKRELLDPGCLFLFWCLLVPFSPFCGAWLKNFASFHTCQRLSLLVNFPSHISCFSTLSPRGPKEKQKKNPPEGPIFHHFVIIPFGKLRCLRRPSLHRFIRFHFPLSLSLSCVLRDLCIFSLHFNLMERESGRCAFPTTKFGKTIALTFSTLWFQ